MSNNAVGASSRAHSNVPMCDVTLMIDKSGSMDERDMPNGQSRWEAAQESVYAVAARVMQFDPDGLNVWLFANESRCYRNVGPETVKQIFAENEPFGGTNMAGVLKKALDEYFARRDTSALKPDGEVMLMVTDGRPDNESEVAEVLIDAAKKLRASDRLALTFIQIGHDARATQYLQFLDTELVPRMHAPCDFVATVKLETIGQQGIKQALLQSLNKPTPVQQALAGVSTNRG